MPNEQAVALLAAALNDPEQTTIGNPYNNHVALSIRTETIEDADTLVTALTAIGCEPRVNVLYSQADRLECRVLIYDLDGQRRIENTLGQQLREERRQELDRLIRARGPIPDEILEGIVRYDRRGVSRQEIADRLNAAGIVDGMRCIRWTAAKVSEALREHQHRLWTTEEAA